MNEKDFVEAGKFIPLNEYTHKYKVSMDELRRKIKLKQVEFVFSNNDYLVKDEPLEDHYFVEYQGKQKTLVDQEERLKKLSVELKRKTEELNKLKSEQEDLKQLCQFLEKENKQMRDIIVGVQKIDEWIANTSKER